MLQSRPALLTLAALVAFAANSVLARLALRGGAIDAASYSALRLAAGAAALALIVGFRGRRPAGGGSWRSAALLTAYAFPFSFAYLALTTGTGALILFGAVQLTMIGAGLVLGDRPPPATWLGAVLATGGLVALVLPGLAAPPPWAAALMALAGAAWGAYSLAGRDVAEPLIATGGNFLRAAGVGVGIALLARLLAPGGGYLTGTGVALAVASGAIASGLGYVAWYAALPGLTRTQAALAQTSVPVIAAAAGVLLLAEPLTPRLVWSGGAIVAGIALAALPPRRISPGE
jgi:drug/metabolite transporter (DMT)-like permease